MNAGLTAESLAKIIMRRSKSQELGDLITEAGLRTEAGERAFARGEAYFESGAVTDLVVSDDTLNAGVEGGDEYAVQLWVKNQTLGYSCTCPVGRDGIFCKHAVAAGLAWLAQGKTTPRAYGNKDDLVSIREWLGRAPHEQMEELLIEGALNDPVLRSRLNANAARAQARRHVDLKALKETVGKALRVSGFVDYYGMRRLIERARPAVDLISGLIKDGHSDAARELTHYALKRGIAAYQRVDDSSGGFGDLLDQIAGLHLEACRAAPPEPAAFGKQFFGLALLDDWGLLGFEDYAPLLGDAGLRAFRALAEKKWEKVPARGAGEDDMRASGDNFRITAVMEALARHDNNVDALVAIKSRNLASPHHFLEIAEILIEAGRRDEALDWAERGCKTFPDCPDSRLTDFLTDEYARRGRYEEAIALAWVQFRHQPTLAAYQRLKTSADGGAWAAWRAKALAWLREDFLKSEKRDRNRLSWQPDGHSLLVEIFLWEGDSDAALARAKAGGCGESLWFAIAEAREAKHPEDAVAIYQARLDTIVKQANNHAYDQAAALIARIRDLTRRTHQAKEFAAWIETVRLKYKARRNFMQRLDKIVELPTEAAEGAKP